MHAVLVAISSSGPPFLEVKLMLYRSKLDVCRLRRCARAATMLAGLVVATAASAGQYRPIDGYGNNPFHPTWGSTGIRLLRESGPYYADGISAPTGTARPNPRDVSNLIFSQDESHPNPSRSDFMWTWGQFLDHDLGLTEGTAEPLPIPVPAGDPVFDPEGTGTAIIPFVRAIFDPTTGTSRRNPRQQLNEITGFIDGSGVYGSDPVRAAWLREGTGGRLKVTPAAVGDLLPYNDGTQPNAGSPEVPDLSTDLFVAGDIRANEQPTLCVMHTLFVREHNFQAARIATDRHLDPVADDETIYQEARQIVVAEIQAITYREFVPALLGPNALPPYLGYRPWVNPGVSAVFSTAAYRLGHTLLSPFIQRLEADGTSVPAGPLALRDAFFSSTPEQLETYGLEPFLRGVARQHTQELDAMVIDDVRNFLFEVPVPGFRGLDLVSLNLQRGRDMGLPDFNRVRRDFGLPRIRRLEQITSDPSNQAALLALYDSVNDIDPFVGFLVEDDLPGRMVGPTLFRVLADQFQRSRDGDRFWYEHVLTHAERRYVEHSTLAEIIRRNSAVSGSQIQDDVFVLN
jgi:peroxidase